MPRPKPRAPAPLESEAPKRWVIDIPGWRPFTLNELISVHWAARSRRKGSDFEWVSVYSHKCGVPRATGRRRVSLTITLEKGKRRPDPDAWWKSLLDALTRAGRLVDDGPKWCELGSVDYARGLEPATRIELEDLP